MQITGTIVNYFVHCKRQCYLHYHKITLEDESELVKIGRSLHESKKTEEITIDNIKVDKIKSEHLIEIKKSDSDLNAAKMQLLYYLYTLEKKGIYKKGKLEVIEKNKKNKDIVSYEVLLNDETRTQLLEVLDKIEKLLEKDTIPPVEKNNKCKKCAYFSYCYI